MIPLNSTEIKPLEFSDAGDPQKFRASTAKIGWLHSESDVPGAKYDLVIKDGNGHVKFERKNCGNETEKFGELVNLATMIGEDLEVSVSNLRGGKKVNIFFN